MKMPSLRMTYFICFMIVAFLIATSVYLQKYDGIIPCPLCLLQRIDLALLGILFFFGCAFSIKRCGAWFVGVLALIVSSAGILLAGRQVWLQHLPPDKNADCGVNLQYLLHVLPYDQVFAKIMQGSAECAQKSWQFLSISLAEWSLLFFILFWVISVGQLLRKPVY